MQEEQTILSTGCNDPITTHSKSSNIRWLIVSLTEEALHTRGKKGEGGIGWFVYRRRFT